MVGGRAVFAGDLPRNALEVLGLEVRPDAGRESVATRSEVAYRKLVLKGRPDGRCGPGERRTGAELIQAAAAGPPG
jgi:hypothetical protein